MQHRSYSTAIRQIFDSINQRESRSELRLHFVLPIANLGERREGGSGRRMRREKRAKRERVLHRRDRIGPSKWTSEGERERIIRQTEKLQMRKEINALVACKSSRTLLLSDNDKTRGSTVTPPKLQHKTQDKAHDL